jgi:methyl-accepting chemotaxis protein
MLTNLSVRRKLLAFSLLGLLFLALVGAAGSLALLRVSAIQKDIVRHSRALQNQMLADMMHDALRGDALSALRAGQAQSAEQFKEVKAALDDHVQTFQDALATLEELQLGDDVRLAVQDVKPALSGYVSSAQSIVSTAQTDAAAAEQQYPQFLKAFEELEERMEQLTDIISQRIAAVEASSAQASQAAQWIIGVAALSGAIVFYWVGRQISQAVVMPVTVAARVADRIAQGDLTHQFHPKGNDELGQLLRSLSTMQDALRRLVAQVREGVNEVDVAAEQIASANRDLSARTEAQASSLEQTAAAMEQLSGTVQHNAGSAATANQLATQASGVATDGGQVVADVVKTMHGINEASSKIADIIGVIDGIAFQTNILALNAAVEAARAGDQGRGFAVVASEVRALAGRSAEAAREIKALIATSVERVDTGSGLVDRAGQSMDQVVTAIRRVTDIVGEISSASAEQSQGVTQVNQAVSQLDQTTQQNAALVEQTAAAADSLSAQARQLVAAVAMFKLDAASRPTPSLQDLRA